jgi:hypothetical protein
MPKRDIPDGYVCSLCHAPGHWISDCSQFKKKKSKKQTNGDGTAAHTPISGQDPSEEDIERAKAIQRKMVHMNKLKPPDCFCGLPSRKARINEKNKKEIDQRARGKWFWFCSKTKGDYTKCKMARVIEERDEEGARVKKVCTFWAQDQTCRKGANCSFLHEGWVGNTTGGKIVVEGEEKVAAAASTSSSSAAQEKEDAVVNNKEEEEEVAVEKDDDKEESSKSEEGKGKAEKSSSDSSDVESSDSDSSDSDEA